MSLSYSITSLSPLEINEKFFQAKQHFSSIFNENAPTKPQHYILKNMAHVTLNGLFYLREGIRDEEVSSALSSVRFNPIPVEAQELTVFPNTKHGNILVALVRKTPELQKLHDDLTLLINTCKETQDESLEKRAFIPHLSILYRLPKEKIDEATSYAQEHILPLRYTLTSFLFMRDVPGVVGERELVKKYNAK